MIPADLKILFGILLEAALRALLAAFVLGLGLRLLRVRNVLAQKAAWCVVLAAALAMPLVVRWHWLPACAEVKLPVPAWLKTNATLLPVAAPARVETSAIQQAPVTTVDRASAPAIPMIEFDTPPDAVTAGSNISAVPVTMPTTNKIAPVQAVPAPGRGLRQLFALGWLAYLGVCGALLFRLFFGLGSSLRLWSDAREVEIAPEFGLPHGIAVRASRRLSSPVNIGSGILLPADYAQWDEEKLRVVLAHESSHVRQRDFYLQLLAGLYSALIWFSPLGWWLKRKLCALGEAISDRAGLEAAGSPSAYAQMLLEFAALPRPAITGVAMAHSTNLSERIERLLNDTHFRQAFAGSRRTLLAFVLTPVSLVAATAFVHVQAAESAAPPVAALQATPSADQAPAQAATSGQSHPDQAQVTEQDAAPAAPPAPQPAPAPTPVPAPGAAQEPPAPPVAPSGMVAPAAPAPPAPAVRLDMAVPPVPPIHLAIPVPPMPEIHEAMAQVAADMAQSTRDFDFRYDNGEAYALVGDPGTKTHYFSSGWDDDRREDIEKARQVAHGHFLWFRHDGKSYIVDDPTIVSQIEAMQKPIDDLRGQMKDLGKQMHEQSEQQREAARKVREESRTNITAPDLSKEMADLDEAVANLKNQQGGTITREQLREIERRLSEVQRKLMTAQMRMDVSWEKNMGEFGKMQGEFGRKMGDLGREMGRVARENNEKIRSIIDESLKNGKARPVE
jgi:beta-lactamase regulating signal transducer with metallopeptidase domain